MYKVGNGSRWREPWCVFRGQDQLLIASGASEAEHICKLLNADPLPEDRPKRYAVTSYADGSCCVTDLAALPSVATFRTHHPDPLAAAQAECDRLNALDAS